MKRHLCKRAALLLALLGTLTLLLTACGAPQKEPAAPASAAGGEGQGQTAAPSTPTEPAEAAEPAKPAEPDTPATIGEPPVEPQPSRSEELAQLYPNGLTNAQEAWAWLDGEWRLLPGGMPAEAGGVTLTFAAGTGEAFFRRGEAELAADAVLDDFFGYLRDGRSICDWLILTPTRNEGFVEEEAMLLGMETHFLFRTALVDGRELLSLRFVGNGDSLITEEGLGARTQTENGLWLFERVPAGESAASDEAALRTGETFYAVCWQESRDVCWLQAVESYEYTEEWFAAEIPVVRSRYTLGGQALTAQPYPRADGGDAASALAGPVLAQVTTDAQGRVTGLRKLMYLDMGLYVQPGSEGQLYDGRVGVEYFDDWYSGIDDYDEFTADESEWQTKLVFYAGPAVQDFRFYALFLKEFDADDRPVFLVKELYSQPELSWERPLVIGMTFYGDTPSYGLSYTDPYGGVHWYAVEQSGEDGSVYLTEF